MKKNDRKGTTAYAASFHFLVEYARVHVERVPFRTGVHRHAARIPAFRCIRPSLPSPPPLWSPLYLCICPNRMMTYRWSSTISSTRQTLRACPVLEKWSCFQWFYGIHKAHEVVLNLFSCKLDYVLCTLLRLLFTNRLHCIPHRLKELFVWKVHFGSINSTLRLTILLWQILEIRKPVFLFRNHIHKALYLNHRSEIDIAQFWFASNYLFIFLLFSL